MLVVFGKSVVALGTIPLGWSSAALQSVAPVALVALVAVFVGLFGLEERRGEV